MKKYIILIVIFSIVFCEAFSQQKKLPWYYKESINVDSLIKHNPYALFLLPEAVVYPKSKKELRKRDKMLNNFLRVYPYALEISQLYHQIEDSLAKFKNDKDRKKYLKVREKQIMAHYKPQLSKFTLSQGVMLVKLLDRESGSTAYEMVEEMKGSVRAFFWQNFALLYGNNLKREYDSKGKDKELEYLVLRYKSGTL
ncbi:MAG: DUF4294 domain-containing protein [Bacteroidales bacterium]|jgi:hypothetical protein|nr:DUF4294 domain-containing protein [Bacteroidales bacterium]HOL98942.1 DUF4294 domain-containing protein [Bacteroidales bacterium]HOM36875.1 DUF4294 domain-containing protein [Bacteroidales bacterium]HPD24196.1 DUF4294 domain-containing protein [Bacteroidales bacterium]HRS99881.1 DUF4294 domain-containing protein [Bacteroidales bacterium]